MSKEEKFLNYLESYISNIDRLIRELPKNEQLGHDGVWLDGERLGVETVRDKFCDLYEV